MRKIFLLSLLVSNIFAKTEIAITVDDLPAAGPTSESFNRLEVAKKYLDTYKKYKFPHQYGFVNGVYLEGMSERAEVMKLWKADGHYFGNHTYSHKGLEELGVDGFKKDIEKNETFLIDYASNISELKVLRFPFLAEGSSRLLRYEIRSYLKNRNYKIAQVSIDTFDWKYNLAYIRCVEKKDQENANKVLDAYVNFVEKIAKDRIESAKFLWGNQKKISHIMLIHLTPLVADASDKIFKVFENNQWSVVDAKEAISNALYEEDTTYISDHGKDFITQALITRNQTTRASSSPKIDNFLDSICQ